MTCAYRVGAQTSHLCDVCFIPLLLYRSPTFLGHNARLCPGPLSWAGSEQPLGPQHLCDDALLLSLLVCRPRPLKSWRLPCRRRAQLATLGLYGCCLVSGGPSGTWCTGLRNSFLSPPMMLPTCSSQEGAGGWCRWASVCTRPTCGVSLPWPLC